MGYVDREIIYILAESDSDWLTIGATVISVLAALIAALALWLARKDIKEATKQMKARTTFEIQKDVRSFIKDMQDLEDDDAMDKKKDQKRDRKKLLLTILHDVALHDLLLSDALSPSLKHIFLADFDNFISTDLFKEFWMIEENRQAYPKSFREFTNEQAKERDICELAGLT